MLFITFLMHSKSIGFGMTLVIPKSFSWSGENELVSPVKRKVGTWSSFRLFEKSLMYLDASVPSLRGIQLSVKTAIILLLFFSNNLNQLLAISSSDDFFLKFSEMRFEYHEIKVIVISNKNLSLTGLCGGGGVI